MINKILARSFKGLSFDQEIDQFTIIVGPNGSGKSARAQALTLSILGYLPQDQVKQPSSIYAIHGGKEEMIVGFEVDGNRFGRRFKPNPDGTVTLDVSYKGKKLAQKEVPRVLIELGDPQICDLKAFNDLTPNKKVEFLLERFPPAGDLQQMDENILKLEEKEKALRADLRGAKSSIERMSMERVGMKLPAGTLAEIQAEIKAKEKDLEEAQEELKRQEIAEREKEAAEKARIKAEEKARREAAELAIIRMQEEFLQRQKEEDQKRLEKEQEQDRSVKEFGQEIEQVLLRENACVESLRIVRDVMIACGCECCEALAVLNAEIEKN